MSETNKKQDVLNAEQDALVTELTETYGIEPEEIIFFQNDKKPFLSYEATCALINQLTKVQDITIEPIQNVMIDSFAVRCTLLTGEGHTRSAVGVANLNESIAGEEMSEQQIYALASARAIRNSLKTAGIDLLKLHYQAADNSEVVDFKPKSNRTILLSQAHILGSEKGLITGNRLSSADNKIVWYHEIWSRYGVRSSSQLTDDQLADFVAFLNAYRPMPTAAAAA